MGNDNVNENVFIHPIKHWNMQLCMCAKIKNIPSFQFLIIYRHQSLKVIAFLVWFYVLFDIRKENLQLGELMPRK